MNKVESFINFVKEQISFQGKMVIKYDDDAYRHSLHKKTLSKFQELLAYLEEIDRRGQATFDSNNRGASAQKRIQLTFEDIQDIPEELIKELNVSETDQQELLIEFIIATSGGILSLDKILVELFRRTKEINKRNTLISRLYRMVQRGVIYNVPGKKGVYSTYELSEDDARRLFGQPEPMEIEGEAEANRTASGPGLAPTPNVKSKFAPKRMVFDNSAKGE